MRYFDLKLKLKPIQPPQVVHPSVHIEVSIALSASVFARIALLRNCVFCECGQVAAMERAAYGGVATQAWVFGMCIDISSKPAKQKSKKNNQKD